MLDNHVLPHPAFLNTGASFRNISNFLYTVLLRTSSFSSLSFLFLSPSPHFFFFLIHGFHLCFVAWFSPVVTGFRAPGLSRPELPSPEFPSGISKLPRSGSGLRPPSAAGGWVPASKVTLQRECGKMVPSAVAQPAAHASRGPRWGAPGTWSAAVRPPAARNSGGPPPHQNEAKWHRLPVRGDICAPRVWGNHVQV